MQINPVNQPYSPLPDDGQWDGAQTGSQQGGNEQGETSQAGGSSLLCALSGAPFPRPAWLESSAEAPASNFTNPLLQDPEANGAHAKPFASSNFAEAFPRPDHIPSLAPASGPEGVVIHESGTIPAGTPVGVPVTVVASRLPPDPGESMLSDIAERYRGAVLGIGDSVLGGLAGTARIGSNMILQVGDLLTMGYNHDHPVMQQAYREQEALGRTLVNAITSPVETGNRAMNAVRERYEQAMAISNPADQSRALASLFNDVGQTALSLGYGTAAVRNNLNQSAFWGQSAGDGISRLLSSPGPGVPSGSRRAQMGSTNFWGLFGNGIGRTADGIAEVRPRGPLPRDRMNALDTIDLAAGAKKPAEAAAAAAIEDVLGTMKRYDGPPTYGRKSPDFQITDGPLAGLTVEMMYTTDDLSLGEVFGMNVNFEKSMTTSPKLGATPVGILQIEKHLKKGDILVMDIRVLTARNQSILESQIRALSPAQQAKILIIR